MTTVVAVARDGRVHMAGDTRTNVYDRPVYGVRKILRLAVADGVEMLLGISGDGALLGLADAQLEVPGPPAAGARTRRCGRRCGSRVCATSTPPSRSRRKRWRRHRTGRRGRGLDVADENREVRSFGGGRRGVKPPADEFPDRVVLPAMVLKPVELPVVLTVDQAMLDEAVALVRETFYAAARAGMAQAIQELVGDEGQKDGAETAPGESATTA